MININKNIVPEAITCIHGNGLQICINLRFQEYVLNMKSIKLYPLIHIINIYISLLLTVHMYDIHLNLYYILTNRFE